MGGGGENKCLRMRPNLPKGLMAKGSKAILFGGGSEDGSHFNASEFPFFVGPKMCVGIGQ